MRRTRARVSALACLLVLGSLSGCDNQLDPYGEVVVSIDTNAAVPTFVGRLRIDVFEEDGTWIDTIDFPTLFPEDYPITFGVLTKDPEQSQDVFVRVRAYPEGKTRDYRGERFVERHLDEDTQALPATKARGFSEACGASTELHVGAEAQLKLGHGVGVMDVASTCEDVPSTTSELGALTLVIPEAGEYVVGVRDAQPNDEWRKVTDPVLSLRESCSASAAELGCIARTSDVLPELEVTLEEGAYSLIVGNRLNSPMSVDVALVRKGDDWPEPEVAPDGVTSETPRLVVDGVDITPAQEPEPNTAIDHLIEVSITPGMVETATVFLHGDCLGTMADLEGRRTCKTMALTLEPVTPERLAEGTPERLKTEAGTWSLGQEMPCRGGAPETRADFGEPLCIRGGAVLVGDLTVISPEPAAPERPAVVAPFWLDSHEYSIGRYRRARADGFDSELPPINNFLELSFQTGDDGCTYHELLTGDILYPEREELPLNCMSWRTAEELCALDGGHLPTTAQWEYAATVADRAKATTYPFGDAAPDCGDVVFARFGNDTRGHNTCATEGDLGPVDVAAEPYSSFDRTPTGVVAMGGNMSEWVLDAHAPYDSECWLSQGLQDPVCGDPGAPYHSIMGGSFRDGVGRTRGATRTRAATGGFDSAVGFRCAYEDVP